MQRPFQCLGQRQRHHSDALLDQGLRLIGCGLPTYAALRRLTFMDLAGFAGKTVPHIFGVLNHLAHHGHVSRLQLLQGLRLLRVHGHHLLRLVLSFLRLGACGLCTIV